MPPRTRPWRLLLPAALLALLAPAGCARSADTPPPGEEALHPLAAAGPVPMPMTVPPRLKNETRVAAALKEHYPRDLRDAGIGGTSSVWFLIDDRGVVRDARLHRSSGYDAIDRAALRVARVMRFTPPRNGDEAVPVWISLNVTFETR